MSEEHKIFSLLKEDNNILEEAGQFTSQLSVFDNDDCELSHRDLEILSQIEEYNEYLEHPEKFGNCNTVYLDDEESGLSFPIDIPIGYHCKGVKETVADNPKAQSLNRCYKRIDKDLSRQIITAEEREILYPLCSVKRKSNPRGRPKAKRRAYD